MSDKRKQTGGRRRGAAVYTPVAALLVLFILIFGISVFFRVTGIEVTGSSRYTADEIIAASGVETGDNLFLIDSDAAARKIKSAMPYISTVRVDRRIPGTAVLEITEGVALGAIQSGSDYWKVDSEGRILERTDYSGSAGLIRISGVTLLSPKEGQKAAVDPAFETQLAYMIDVLTAIHTSGIGPDVSALDMTNISLITMTYKTTVTIRMGGGDNAEFKIERMLDVYEKQDAGFKGTIDVSKDDHTNVIVG